MNLLKSGLNGGQKGIFFFVHVNMSVSRIILILVANWQEIFGEWLINPRPKTESSEVTLVYGIYKLMSIIEGPALEYPFFYYPHSSAVLMSDLIPCHKQNHCVDAWICLQYTVNFLNDLWRLLIIMMH